MRILIAEDDRIIADGLGRSLRQTGYAVDWVANGADADNALTTGAYDLVILDLGLPRMPGLDVLKRLRARKSWLCSRTLWLSMASHSQGQPLSGFQTNR